MFYYLGGERWEILIAISWAYWRFMIKLSDLLVASGASRQAKRSEIRLPTIRIIGLVLERPTRHAQHRSS